jgi:hypothetical protein
MRIRAGKCRMSVQTAHVALGIGSHGRRGLPDSTSVELVIPRVPAGICRIADGTVGARRCESKQIPVNLSSVELIEAVKEQQARIRTLMSQLRCRNGTEAAKLPAGKPNPQRSPLVHSEGRSPLAARWPSRRSGPSIDTVGASPTGIVKNAFPTAVECDARHLVPRPFDRFLKIEPGFAIQRHVGRIGSATAAAIAVWRSGRGVSDAPGVSPSATVTRIPADEHADVQACFLARARRPN